MLTEELRILAGLQESKEIVNPLPEIIKNEENNSKIIKLRKENEQKTVLGHFQIFEDKFNNLSNIMHRFDNLIKNKDVFMDGLIDNNYQYLQQAIEIMINESTEVFIMFIENNKNDLIKEFDMIDNIKVNIDESKLKDFFVASDLNKTLYKDILLKEKKDNIGIEYGDHILILNDNLAIIKKNNKRFYFKLTEQEILYMVDNNILL